MALLVLHVTPGASSDRVGPHVDGILHVRVTKRAADGEANRAVVRLVADAIGVAPSTLELRSGRRSRDKRLEVEGLDPRDLSRRLARLV